MLRNVFPFHQCSGMCQGEEAQRQLAVTVVLIKKRKVIIPSLRKKKCLHTSMSSFEIKHSI